jgi:hypothetical protein
MNQEERAVLASVLKALLAEDPTPPAAEPEPKETPDPSPKPEIPYWETVAEKSNPGPVGVDTGYVFNDPVTHQPVRVIAEVGQSRGDAIRETRMNHGLDEGQRLEKLADAPSTGEET